jgi:hypothetical protein
MTKHIKCPSCGNVTVKVQSSPRCPKCGLKIGWSSGQIKKSISRRKRPLTAGGIPDGWVGTTTDGEA